MWIMSISIHRDNPIDGVLDLTFAVDAYVNGELIEVELVPGGAEKEVTDENKAEYVGCVAMTTWKMHR